MKILGIESSCDETGVAVYDTRRGILGERLFSQVALHADYGGVVPELASRDHIRRLIPQIRSMLEELELDPRDMDAVAYTAGPGLSGALLTGAAVATGLGMALGIPTLPIHHMEGHLLAPMLETPAPTFPFVALLVSGGHTQLVQVEGLGKYRVLGETLDDAAGEAFDKVAKMLGLPYPGGPEIARLADRGRPGALRLPRPMVDRPGLEMSFSGLKTAAITAWRQLPAGVAPEQHAADVAHAFQEAVCDTLAIKCSRALQESGHKTLVVAGGVSANSRLRQCLKLRLDAIAANAWYARLAYCTDNGAMIAFAGALRLSQGDSRSVGSAAMAAEIMARPRWPLAELKPAHAG